MADNNYDFTVSEEFSSDIRSEHNEEYYLNLRIKMDKKLLDELSSMFGGEQSGEYPVAVRKLLGGKLPFDVYMANSSGEAHPQSINMVLATDTANKYNTDIVRELDNMTLSVYGFNTPDWFTVTGIRKVPAVVGTVNNRVLKAEIVFFYNHSTEADSIGQGLVDRIFELPNIFDETKLINQRISHWDEYLKINESFAEEAQVLLDYSGYRPSHNISQIVFNVSSDELLPAHNNSDIQLVLGVEKEYGNTVYKGPVIGTISSYSRKNSELTVDLDFEFRELWQNGGTKIPHSAKLFVTKWGDLVQLRRLRYGLNTFARGQAENPRLDVFIFDSSKARTPAEPREVLSREALLQHNLNDEQHRAVEGVINSPDLYLIQGPPGTGKTTVIAEICYQNAIRGQKTLIASQTNLAVDNALGKLIHHPKIRALRKGNEQSVQEEGKLFTENNIIKTWLGKTANDCAGLLAEKEALVSNALEAEQKLAFIEEQYELFQSAVKSRNSNAVQKANVEHSLEKLKSTIRWLNENCTRFLRDVKGEGYINLVENPYDISSEYIDVIKKYHATKVIYDEKRLTYESDIATIKSEMENLQNGIDVLTKEYLKATKNQKHSLPSGADVEGENLSYDEWQNEAIILGKEINEIYRKKPMGILIALGFSKKWTESVISVIKKFRLFEASSRRTLALQNRFLDAITEDDAVPLIFARLKEMTENLLNTWHTELCELQDKLTAVDDELSQNKLDIRASREQISEFNYTLPYGAEVDDIEQVCHVADIKQYYLDKWQTQKDDDSKIAGFVASWTKRLAEKTEQDYAALKQLYISNANVIGITCSQSGSREFTSVYPTFDVAIIDEVSKATPPELILSVLKAKKIVLVGDHKQLPPMVGSDTYEEVAKKLDIPSDKIQHMKASLFEELFVNAPSSLKTMLSTQYRMHSQIMDTINQFYVEENGYGLRCGLPNPDKARAHGCHGKAISPRNHALWVDVPLFEENHEERSGVNHSYSNRAEVECIRDILLTLNENLTANNFEGKKKIGIISFYSNQVRLMENEFHNKAFADKVDKLSLRIGSVDRFQGIECPVVICSFVRNNSKGEIGFAKDPRRVNVALSRAQELSIIVGCSELFCDANKDSDATEIYKTISKYIYVHGGERSAWDFQ